MMLKIEMFSRRDNGKFILRCKETETYFNFRSRSDIGIKSLKLQRNALAKT